MSSLRCRELSVIDLFKQASPPPTPFPTSSNSSSSGAIADTSPPLTSSSPSWKSRCTAPISTFAQNRNPAYMRATRYPGSEVGASSNRRYSTRVKLDPVKQLSYDRDGSPEVWVDILKFIQDVHDPFPPTNDPYENQLTTDIFRQIQRDLVKLVELNRKRGYDISEDIRHDNVLVEVHTGKVMLKSVCGNFVTRLAPFKGYRAAGTLFHTLLWTNRHGKCLSEDNIDFQMLLASATSNDVPRIIYHASLLSRAGRAAFNVKIPMLMRHDLPKLVPRELAPKGIGIMIHDFYRSLPYTTEVLDMFPTDFIHDDFKEMRKKSEDFKNQDRTPERTRLLQNNKDLGLAWKSITGNWLMSMSRNGTLHLLPGQLQSEAVDHLHSHSDVPTYGSQEILGQ